MQNEIAYSRPVTLTNILRFAVPTIAMSVFMSFYTMVDGLFVSNLIGTSALSALNLVYPVIALVTAISTMLATGGSAAIMRKMGEGKPDEAKQDFTFLILVNVLTGLVMCGLGYLFMGKIFGSMSLSPEVSAYCWEYLSRYLLFTVPILLMNNFTLYMIAAGKASLSLLCSVAGGVTNIVLDYLFIAVFRWGIGGAAVATGLGYSITAIVGLLVFSNRNSLLHFVRPVCRPQTLGRAVTNGCSEMATALVNGIITLMFNWTMLHYVGEDGVAAITIIMYVLMFATSLYTGYSYGVAPMVSFYYGEQNRAKLKRLVSISFRLIGAMAVMMLLLSQLATRPLVSIFARPGNPVYDLAVTGNRICSIALLFIGFNVFASGMFTALSNGIVGFTAVAAGMTGSATAADMTPANIHTFEVCAFWTPLVLIVLSLLVFAFKVKINEKMHAEIVEQLEAKLVVGEIPDEEAKTVETVEASTRRPIL